MTATTPSWTAVSTIASWRPAYRLVARMCAAKLTAQRNTSPSPERRNPEAPPDRRNSPTKASTAPIAAVEPTQRRHTSASSSGTSTTNMPVMKPALEELVRSNPKVWKRYPAPRKRPISAPPRIIAASGT